MADDLELELRAIAGEGPSPEFVASLRERVLAEAAAPRVTTSDGEIVAVVPRPLDQEERTMTKNRWMLAGAAAAVIALIVGLVVVAGGGDDTTPIDEPTTVPTSEVPTTTSPATTAPTTAPDTTPVEDATPFGDAAELPAGFTGLEPGAHWTDTLGVPFAFEIDQSLFLQENRRTAIALSSPSSSDPGDKDMVFRPLDALWNPDRLAAGDGDASAAGLVAHLESLDGRVVVSNRDDVTIDGREATRFDIEVDTNSCEADIELCDDLAPSESGLSDTVEVGWAQRIWVIEVGDDPITVVASYWNDRDAVWLDVVGRYVSTMTFAAAS